MTVLGAHAEHLALLVKTEQISKPKAPVLPTLVCRVPKNDPLVSLCGPGLGLETGTERKTLQCNYAKPAAKIRDIYAAKISILANADETPEAALNISKKRYRLLCHTIHSFLSLTCCPILRKSSKSKGGGGTEPQQKERRKK